MSFRDFNDEGPGTFEWDYVLGGNTTGLFPEEMHFAEMSCNLVKKKYNVSATDTSTTNVNHLKHRRIET